MKKIILLASLFFLLIAPFTYHPDTKLTLFYPSLNNGKVWNIYKYLETNLTFAPDFHYPPLHFWALKAQYTVSKIMVDKGFDKWLASDSTRAVTANNFFKYNLASKVPLLLLAIASGWVIFKLTGSLLASAIWYFNPVTLYAVVMMGQNDILAIFPFLLGLLFYWNIPWLAFFIFGVSAGIKTYPLIWAIILGLGYPTKNWYKKIGLTLISFVVYLLPLLPFLSDKSFLNSVVYSGLASRIFASSISLGFGEVIFIVPVALIYLTFKIAKKGGLKDISLVSKTLLTANLLILGFSHFNPQWLLWIIPFLSMWLVCSLDKNKWIYSLFLLSFWVLVILLFEDKFLYWGILAPINPGLLNLPFLKEIFMKFGVQPDLLNNMAHSGIAAVALYFLFNYSEKKYGKVKNWNLKLLKLPLILKPIVPIIILLIVLFGINLFPSIKNSNNEVKSGEDTTYINLNELANSSILFKSKKNNLYRIELSIKNPNNKSGDFAVKVIDENKNILASQNFTDLNIGDQGKARLDFATIVDSENKNYFVEINSSDKKDTGFEVESFDKNKIEVNSFYKDYINIKSAWFSSWSSLLTLSFNYPLWLLSVLVIAFLTL